MLLPMSLALTAALSQDGPMLACTALAAALVRMQQARTDRRLLLCLVLLLALVGAARPPYAGFALLLLTLPIRLRTRLLCVSLVLACVVGWSALMAPHVVLAVFPDGAVNPRAQLLELVQSPFKLLTIAQLTWHAHASEFATGFIGKLGWLDVDLPQAYRSSAYVVLGLAALSCMARGRWKLPTPSTCVATLGIVISVAGILMAQYLTWTLPGRLVIEGVQGRYFLPPAIMLAALLPARGISRSWPSQLEWPVLAFPIITLPVTVHAVVLRYYF
jgi:uncharacterized membrane protein